MRVHDSLGGGEGWERGEEAGAELLSKDFSLRAVANTYIYMHTCVHDCVF